ncbi:MAG: elongation factor G [Bacillota bacterium]
MTANSNNIKNVSFIAHGGAGKTTLTEMCLLNSGEINNAGNVDEGNTHSDFIPEEKNHKYSINNSYFTFNWNNKQVNLIDTPGYPDFRGEVSSALRMVEGAVLLIDGTAGIEVNTKYVWDRAEENNLTRFIFINKMDEEGANFSEVYEELQNDLDQNLLPITVPSGEGENYQGVLDVLTQKKINNGNKEDISDESLIEDYRIELIETIVELDDELMMKYLEDEPISDKEITNALIEGVKAKEIIPVFSGSALQNSGVETLLNYLIKLTPGPLEREKINGISGEEKVDFEIKEDGPLVGIVGKTMVDPYIGKLSIFRIYSGNLKKGQEVYIPRINEKLTMSKLYKLNGSEQDQLEQLVTGDIGAVAKMDELETSDTICSPETDIELDEIEFPEPMLIQAASPADGVDEEKMSTALNRYSKEDPTFKVNYNKETKELVITGMGSIHLSVIKDMCKRKFEVDFVTSTPKVTYKETIQTKVDVEEKYKKQSGGRGQYGHVLLKIEPLPRGEGFEFKEEIFGGAIPKQYIPGVEKGIREAKEEGVLAGYPVVDFKAIVYDGSYHDVDSSEMAFKIASSRAFKKGVQQAKPVLLEPVMKVQVVVPERFMGDIMGDLNSRRGKISGMNPEGGNQIINAEVPEGEMFSYVSDLKSITGGYGHYTMEFSHYDKVPAEEQEKIIAAAE